MSVDGEKDFDIVYLFSSPLVKLERTLSPTTGFYNDKYVEVPTLDFESERDVLKNAFSGVKKKFSLFSSPAILTVLSQVTYRCKILHYSGHGEQDHLLCEDKEGNMYPYTINKLRDLFYLGKNRIKLVVVSACHSEKIGSTIASVGVPHVIAIRACETVSDVDARTFNRTFYERLLEGASVSEAFNAGVIQAVYNANRSTIKDKFLLLPLNEKHDETIFSLLSVGELDDRSPAEPNNNLNRIPDVFVGRNMAIYSISRALFDKSVRLINVWGKVGVGKTALMSALGKFLLDRPDLFSQGIFMASLLNFSKNTNSSEPLSIRIAKEFNNNRDGYHLITAYTTNEELVADYISNHRNDHCLFIFDEVDSVLDELEDIITGLRNHCAHLKFIIITKAPVSSHFEQINIRLIEIVGLTKNDALTLFNKRTVFDISSSSELKHEQNEKLLQHKLFDFCNGIPAMLIKAANNFLRFNYTLDQVLSILQAESKIDDNTSSLPIHDIKDIKNELYILFNQHMPQYLKKRQNDNNQNFLKAYWKDIVENGCQFWLSLDIHENMSITWEFIAQKLRVHFANTTAFRLDDERHLDNNDLRFLYHICFKGFPLSAEMQPSIISPQLFVPFWIYFDALEKMVKLPLNSIWNNSYYDDRIIEGCVTREAAELKLSLCDIGTFLLRFSESNLGNIAVSYVNTNKTITHFLIDCLHADFSPEKKISVVYSNNERGEWNTIEDVIIAHRELLKIYPNIPKRYAFASVEPHGDENNYPC